MAFGKPRFFSADHRGIYSAGCVHWRRSPRSHGHYHSVDFSLKNSLSVGGFGQAPLICTSTRTDHAALRGICTHDSSPFSRGICKIMQRVASRIRRKTVNRVSLVRDLNAKLSGDLSRRDVVECYGECSQSRDDFAIIFRARLRQISSAIGETPGSLLSPTIFRIMRDNAIRSTTHTFQSKQSIVIYTPNIISTIKLRRERKGLRGRDRAKE